MMQWNLIKLRKENNISQEYLAKALDISERSYGMKERGESDFRVGEMIIIHNIFGISMDEIFLPTNCILNAEKGNLEEAAGD